jgi:hypothetical protein
MTGICANREAGEWEITAGGIHWMKEKKVREGARSRARGLLASMRAPSKTRNFDPNTVLKTFFTVKYR